MSSHPPTLLYGRTALGENVPVRVDGTGLLAGGGNPFDQDLNTTDAAVFTSVRSTGALQTSGYTTGAGGTVTQQTNASTAVTLNTPCGQITTVALTTVGGAEERFTVNNSLVTATDVPHLATTYNGQGTPMLGVLNVTAGAFDVVITNLSASALNAVVVINVAVHKAVSS